MANETDWETSLSELEEHQINKAITKRKKEFRAGRNSAKRAIKLLLGQQPEAISVKPDRSPDWPLGVVGSISHNNNICIAAVTLSKNYCSIGFDVEENIPLENNLIQHICTKNEILNLNNPVIAKYLFSVKESFFKAFSPIKMAYLDFLDAEFSWFVEETIDIDHEHIPIYRFKLEHLSNDWEFFRNVDIKLSALNQHIYCVATLQKK